MKPFNLEEAKAGKPVCTRDGRNVRILCFDRQAPSPIVGLVYAEGIGEFCCIFNANGEAGDADLSNDLFMKPEKHEGWVNVYKKDGGKRFVGKQLFNTFVEAMNHGEKCNNYIQTIKIMWEE